MTSDEKLSEAQRLLRDGRNDILSAAVADARNLLNDIDDQLSRRERMFEAAGGNPEEMQGSLTCHLPYTLLRAALRPAQRVRKARAASPAKGQEFQGPGSYRGIVGPILVMNSYENEDGPRMWRIKVQGDDRPHYLSEALLRRLVS